MILHPGMLMRVFYMILRLHSQENLPFYFSPGHRVSNHYRGQIYSEIYK